MKSTLGFLTGGLIQPDPDDYSRMKLGSITGSHIRLCDDHCRPFPVRRKLGERPASPFHFSSWSMSSMRASAGGLDDLKKKPRVVIIGGGIGGLATAARLAVSGACGEITIYEKNGEAGVGGRCESVDQFGIRFDTGPSLMLGLNAYREFYKDMGIKNMEDVIRITRVDPSYSVFGEGVDQKLIFHKDLNKIGDQMEAMEPGSKVKFHKFMDYAKQCYIEGWPNFIDKKMERLFGDFLGPSSLQLLVQLDPLKSLQKKVGEYFTLPFLQSALTYQMLYVGTSPYTAGTSVFALLSWMELGEGVYYPVGGFRTISGSIRDLCIQHGVGIKCGEVVELVRERCDGRRRNRVCGFKVKQGDADEDRLIMMDERDVIICNMDYTLAQTRLLKRCIEGKKYRYSNSSYNYYWKTNRRVSELTQHNTFLSGGGREFWDEVYDASQSLKAPRNLSFYIHRPSATDASTCGADLETDSLMVLVPISPSQNNDDIVASSSGAESDIRKAVLDRLRRHGIKFDIVEEFIYTSQTWHSKYNLDRGSIFGLAHDLLQLAYFRPSLQDAELGNLFYVGASVQPGNGVPLVLTGSKLVTERVLKHMENSSSHFESLKQ